MDEMMEMFDNTLGSVRESAFKNLYKNRGKFGDQQQRRNEIIKQQKSNRRNTLDSCRGIMNLMESARARRGVFNHSHHSAPYRPSVYVPGFTKNSNRYEDILMLSEWLIEKPEDFTTSWYVTPCPQATRVLVLACNGNTKCYTKYGQFLFSTATLLPGGNRQQSWSKCSALDCFYDQNRSLMYVLDVLAWNNHIMADGEMEFRQFWLQSKFSEEPDLMKLSKKNKLKFELLPMIPCNDESLQKFMMTYPPPLQGGLIDGLLFYHKEGHYVAGETPLVGWLYPYMVPEVLGSDITIHSVYESTKPRNYVDQATYIQLFEEKASKKSFGRNRNRTQSNASEAATMEAQDGAQVAENDSTPGDAARAIEDSKDEKNVAVTVGENTNDDIEEPKDTSLETTMEAEQLPQLPHVDTILEAEIHATRIIEANTATDEENAVKEVPKNNVKAFFSYFENK